MPKGERFYVRIARGFFSDCRQESVIVFFLRIFNVITEVKISLLSVILHYVHFFTVSTLEYVYILYYITVFYRSAELP